MTSDCADSLRWAQATYESGRLISEEFNYAAILPFGGNLIFLPFIALFGYSMAAQICGLTLFAAIFTGALYYFARGLGLGRLGSSSLVTFFLLIMSSSAKLREIMWEHIFYYNLGLLFFLVGFGLVFRLIRKGGIMDGASGGRYDYINFVLLLVFAFIAATDGLQTLVCFTLPVIAGIFAERMFDAEDTLTSRRNMSSLAVLAGITAVSAAGFAGIGLITNGVSAGYADAYSTYSAMSSWSSNFLGFMNNWFSLLGVSAEAGDPLVSLVSIRNIIGIFGGLVLLFAPLALLFGYSRIKSPKIKTVLIGHLAVSAFIIFAVTFGRLGGANWRLTPMLGTAVLLTVITAFEFLSRRGVAARFGVLLAAVMIVMAAVPVIEIVKMPHDYGRENSWHTAAAELRVRGLKYGYANFWWAQSVTMFSDGEVQVANIRSDITYPEEYPYQLPHGSFEDKETDRYFLMLTESENKKMAAWLNKQRAEGNITEEFTIVSDEYNLRGYVGTALYIYVFPRNIF